MQRYNKNTESVKRKIFFLPRRASAIAELFVKDYISSFDKAPRKIILDIDDTNANTYGAQQLSLFNDYYDEYCYMPLDNHVLFLPISQNQL